MLLRYKTLLLTTVPLAIVLLVMGGLTAHNKIDTERQLLLNRLDSYRVLLESGDLAFETSANKEKLEAFFDEKVEFSEIINKKYEVIYSSENSAAPVITEEEKKEIDDAFAGFQTVKNVQAGDGKKAALVIFTPLIVNERIVAVLHQGLSNEKSEERVMQYALYIAIFIASGIAVCIVSISILLNKVILGSIYELKRATIAVQKGSFDATANVRAKDEVGNLASTFNSMIQEIKGSRKKLEEYSKDLEKKVKERTEELEKSKNVLENANTDLERFNKLAVGRELKMVELKKRIAELEAKSGKKKS